MFENKLLQKKKDAKEKAYVAGMILREKDEIGFGDEVKTIHRRDVFLCHATDPQMIVGLLRKKVETV